MEPSSPIVVVPPARFDLFVFAEDTEVVRSAEAAGAAGVLIDWERAGKERRQAGYDTQINRHTADDLRNARRLTGARIICRTDRGPDQRHLLEQIDLAADLGCDEVLLPMVRSEAEVVRVLDHVQRRHRIGVGIMLETMEAVAARHALAHLPLTRVYVGLNDLAICRGTRHLFEPVASGLLERMVAPFSAPVGFAGLTLAERGSPIPCRLLMGEMLRLGCRFSFLRRSFLRDTAKTDRAAAIAAIHQTMSRMAVRSRGQQMLDHAELLEAVGRFAPVAEAAEAVAGA